MEDYLNKRLLYHLRTLIKSLCKPRNCQEGCPRRTNTKYKIGIELIDILNVVSFYK